MFEIVDTPIDADRLRTQLLESRAGALVTFDGWVRDHNEGKAVNSLEYEAYTALATSEGQCILEEALAKYEILAAVCTHRVGHLNIGDIAVWVGVSSAHRDAAFMANRYIIDEIKHRLPIWKKEHYVEGDAEWVNCQECARHAAKRHGETAQSGQA
jgi:molybdopterin synthase catalytic subunit